MGTRIQRLGVIANCGKDHAPAVLRRLAGSAKALGIRLFTCDQTSRLLPEARRVAPQRLASIVDAVIAMGGDGTLLHAVHLLGRDRPVLGVNLGKLGFLTSATEEQIEEGLGVLASGDYRVSTRSMLECAVRRGDKRIGLFLAMNDIVVGWGQSSRIIEVEAALGRDQITSYRCDGLIVSTPTGSTGHSLSAGGPILHPESRAIMLNVICPHTLSNRPVVLPDDVALTLRVTAAARPLLLAADGQEELRVRQGDSLRVRRSSRVVRLVLLPGHNYFAVLRHKLQWRGSSVLR
jgi:NAD+ kinase